MADTDQNTDAGRERTIAMTIEDVRALFAAGYRCGEYGDAARNDGETADALQDIANNSVGLWAPERIEHGTLNEVFDRIAARQNGSEKTA